MAVTISVGSGKGGTGKSMVIANLALLLAKTGKKVCLVDLDIGGADANILFGLFNPKYTLTDFFTRRVESINDVIHTFDKFYGLQLITGTGETMQTANMLYQEKQRLLRNLAIIDADVILIDVGAGTSYHVLDFFMFSDIQICVTTPDPTSIIDFYRFLKLATIRKALSSFLSHDQVSKVLRKHIFQTIDEIFVLAEETKAGSSEKAQQALKAFHPFLVINEADDDTNRNKMRLRKVATKFLGVDLPELGEIPFDKIIREALKAYQPICEFSPNSHPSRALDRIAANLISIMDRINRKHELTTV